MLKTINVGATIGKVLKAQLKPANSLLFKFKINFGGFELVIYQNSLKNTCIQLVNVPLWLSGTLTSMSSSGCSVRKRKPVV